MPGSKDSIARLDEADFAADLPRTEAMEKTDGRLGRLSFQEDVNPFRRSFLRLYGCLFVAYLCSATNGFDANTFGECLHGTDDMHRHSPKARD